MAYMSCSSRCRWNALVAILNRRRLVMLLLGAAAAGILADDPILRFATILFRELACSVADNLLP